jgi:hypothetical protein
VTGIDPHWELAGCRWLLRKSSIVISCLSGARNSVAGEEGSARLVEQFAEKSTGGIGIVVCGQPSGGEVGVVLA